MSAKGGIPIPGVHSTARLAGRLPMRWSTSTSRRREVSNEMDGPSPAGVMDAHVRDVLVTGFEDLVPSLELPDPGDRHVLAAAIRAEADIIVTANLKDFPASSLAPHGLEAEHPDAFLARLERPVARPLRRNAPPSPRSLAPSAALTGRAPPRVAPFRPPRDGRGTRRANRVVVVARHE